MVRLIMALIPSLVGRLRRALGRSGGEAHALKPKVDRPSGGDLLRRKRIKVALMAIVFGIVSGAIDLPLPAEDALRLARAQLRKRPAPLDIAVIKIDDRTLNELAVALPTRHHDSQLIERLVAADVKKIVFDRAHANPETPASDAAFARTLAKHSGMIWMGMTPESKSALQDIPSIVPHKLFRDKVGMASMLGMVAPFGLSVVFPTEVKLGGRSYPTISALLADYHGPAVKYRPDPAIDPSTVPAYSYIDVLRGSVGANELAGKSVIIGETFIASRDVLHHPLHGSVPGSYLHVLGAHTLKGGTPLDLMWFPAMLVAAIAIALLAFSQKRLLRGLWIAALGLVAVTFVLDEMLVSLDVMSALLALGFAAFGYARINNKYFSAGVDAMTTSAISSDEAQTDWHVFALKIANLAELSEEWTARDVGDFVNTLIGYVKGPGEIGDIAFDRDILVWLAPRMEAGELERHADGLALMLRTAISHKWQSSNSASALGVDTNCDLPVTLRIKKAMQAADEAAARGVRFIINDAAHLEARNNRLGMIRLLERGLRDRDIRVAYQPKVDLASGQIVGAETLIRWQPDGGDFVNPQDLVLAAEASDRINELTLQVMESALVDGKQAIALDPRFKLAVNISAKSLSDTHLLFDMMTLLGRHNFPPENLTLELTETAKLEDRRIAPQIAALKARGIGLSIDDFGTGQSNLEYIEKLPSSELKIDKRFVLHMANSEESRAVVRATIEIAHSLGKLVVATLRAMGCDQAQGYLFSEAIDMRELLVMMRDEWASLNA